MTREEAIKAIKSHCYFANLVPVGKEALDMAIEALEGKDTNVPTKWISVSERLPEVGSEVLVSGYDTYGKRVLISRYQGEQYGFTCGLVSEWMPLPKAYKVGE